MRGHNSNYLCHNICIFEIVNIFRLSWWISTFLAFLFSFMFTLISVLVFHVICLILTQTDETHFVFCCRINRNESSPETRVYLPSNNHLHVKRRDFSEGGGVRRLPPTVFVYLCICISNSGNAPTRQTATSEQSHPHCFSECVSDKKSWRIFLPLSDLLY